MRDSAPARSQPWRPLLAAVPQHKDGASFGDPCLLRHLSTELAPETPAWPPPETTAISSPGQSPGTEPALETPAAASPEQSTSTELACRPWLQHLQETVLAQTIVTVP